MFRIEMAEVEEAVICQKVDIQRRLSTYSRSSRSFL